MKVHYINILMFALPLNILVYNQRNHKSITLHTPNESPIKTHRSLCECELYAPQNYDNDPEMKSVMKDFDRQTSQRLREYDERMIKNRQKCKNQCDKDIEKIILKDKIEKGLKDKLAALETNINTKDLPICECEKSLTDKVEKGCLGCGVLGSGIAPNVGLFGEVVLGAWKTAALVTAKELAEKAGAAKGAAAGVKAGIKIVIDALDSEFGINKFGGSALKFVFDETNYTKVLFINNIVYTEYQGSCVTPVLGVNKPICDNVAGKIFSGYGVSHKAVIKKSVESIASDAQITTGAIEEMVTKDATATLTIKKTGMVEATYASCQNAIIASVVAILVIVLVMVIIYLILRYRRKKKMKKKLQYIKLLTE
ncbi:rifin [Plasmodium sp. gorilla clade G1]|nr:rifin [Plasmodium sp. gorilla clade G1]